MSEGKTLRSQHMSLHFTHQVAPPNPSSPTSQKNIHHKIIQTPVHTKPLPPSPPPQTPAYLKLATSQTHTSIFPISAPSPLASFLTPPTHISQSS